MSWFRRKPKPATPLPEIRVNKRGVSIVGQNIQGDLSISITNGVAMVRSDEAEYVGCSTANVVARGGGGFKIMCGCGSTEEYPTEPEAWDEYTANHTRLR